MPGARRIKVVFDPRSRTETTCDWLSIVQERDDGAGASSHHPEKRGHAGRYHGRGGRENFPGFGGRPPLWLEGDQLTARFRSDPTTTDWGVRFTVYGVLDDDSNRCHDGGGAVSVAGSVTGDVSEGAAAPVAEATGVAVPGETGDASERAREENADVAWRAGTFEADLCCWLLEVLSREGRKVPEVAARLCGEDALRVFQACLKAFPPRRQLRILRVVSCVFAEARLAAVAAASLALPRPPSGTPPAGDVDDLFQVVLGLADAQRVLEGDPATASPFLQALVQCAVTLHVFLVSVADRTGGGLADRSEDEDPISGAARTPARVTQSTRTAETAPATDTDVPVWGESSWSFDSGLVGLGPGARAVREVAAVAATLSDFAQGTSPLRLLLEDFLPILMDAFSVTVQSGHPFEGLRAQKRSVVVPGAVGMQARFDHRTEMAENDRIIIRHPRGRGVRSLATVSPKLATGGSSLLPDGAELSFLGLAGGTNEANLPRISVGDWVIRGPDWAFGDEDLGGEGEQGFSTAGASSTAHARIGVVIALEKWGGRDGEGVRVRWVGDTAAGAEVTERGNGFDALYSVRNPAHVQVVKRGGSDRARRPVVVAGDALEVEVVPAGGGSDLGSGSGHKITEGSSCNDGGAGGGRSSAHCFRFDGESTHVDLPGYRGMRLEGDFTLEVWAWLDPGAARDGKAKCVFSRALDQPFHQGSSNSSRHATTGDRLALGLKAVAARGCVPAGGSGEEGAPPLTCAEHDGSTAGAGDGDGRQLAHANTARDLEAAPTGASEAGPDRCSFFHSRDDAPEAPLSDGRINPHVSTAVKGSPAKGALPAVELSDGARPGFEDDGVSPVASVRGCSSLNASCDAEAKAIPRVKRGIANQPTGEEGGRSAERWEWVGLGGRARAAVPSVFGGPPVSLPGGERRDSDDSTDGVDADEEEAFSLDDDEQEDDDKGADGVKKEDDEGEERSRTLSSSAGAGVAGGVAVEDGSAGASSARVSEDGSTSGQV